MAVKDENMPAPDKDHDTVPALRRAVRILDLVGQRGTPPNAAEIARELSLPRSSAHGLINVMVELGLLEHAAGLAHPGYQLGSRLLDWAGHAGGRQDLLGSFHQLIGASPELASYTVNLSVLEGNEVVSVASRTSERGLGIHYSVGMKLPAVYTAAGMAQLSAMDTGTFREWLSIYPPSTWPEPPTSHGDPETNAILQQIARARETGFAIDDEQIHHGVWCFAAPVRDVSGSVVAALGLSQPKNATAQANAERVAKLASTTAAALSLRLGYRGP